MELNDIPWFGMFEEGFVPMSILIILTFIFKWLPTHFVVDVSVTITVWPVHINVVQSAKRCLIVIPKRIVTTWSRLKSCWNVFGSCVRGVDFVLSPSPFRDKRVYLDSRSLKSKSSLTDLPFLFGSLMQLDEWLVASHSCFFLVFLTLHFVFPFTLFFLLLCFETMRIETHFWHSGPQQDRPPPLCWETWFFLLDSGDLDSRFQMFIFETESRNK